MRPVVIASVLGLSIASVVACTSAGDRGESGSADLSAAPSDAGAPLTPVHAAEKKLVGAWVNPGSGDGPVAYIVSALTPSGGLNVDRDTPHKNPASDQPGIGDRNSVLLSGEVLTVDGSGGGTLVMSEFVFGGGPANHRNELYRFALSSAQGAGGADTLTLTETSETFTTLPFERDGGGSVDGGPTTLRPPITLTRAPSFCGAFGSGDCFSQFNVAVFQPTIPPECVGRESLCFSCTPAHTCAVQVPSSCELMGFACTDSIEKCEFGTSSTGTAGQVTTVDPDGNPIDCKGARSGKPVCCQQFVAPGIP